MKRICLLLALMIIAARAVLGQSTIDPAHSFAYAPNAGWINFRNTSADGVVVSAQVLSGYAHGANVGWIFFGDGTPDSGPQYSNTGDDCGVNRDAAGNLSGFACGANVGWINFGWAAPGDPDRARFDPVTGLFAGYALSANLGWVMLGTGYLRTIPPVPLTPPSLSVDGAIVARQTDLTPGSTNPSQFVTHNGETYFVGAHPTLGSAIYRITPTGAEVAVAITVAGGGDPGFFNLTSVGDALFFVATNGIYGYELFRYRTGTTTFFDLYPGATDSFPANLTNVNGRLFFTATDDTHGEEVWSMSPAGFPVVKDVNPGSAGSFPSRLTAAGFRLAFIAEDATNGREARLLEPAGFMYTVDNDAVENGGIRDGSASLSFSTELFAVGDTLYLASSVDEFGLGDVEIWRVQTGPASVSTASLLMTSLATFGSGGPFGARQFTNADGVLYFVANSVSHGVELWKVATSTSSAAEVADIAPGVASANPSQLRNVGGVLYFGANDGTNGEELWRTSPTGVEMVEDSVAGGGFHPTDGSSPSLYPVSSGLYFLADDGTHGRELWRVRGDGLAERLTDLVPGAGDMIVLELAEADGKIYFTADDQVNGLELWTLSSTGTPLLVNAEGYPGGIYPGSQGSSPSLLNTINGQLFFTASSAGSGSELRRLVPGLRTYSVRERTTAVQTGRLSNPENISGITFTTRWLSSDLLTHRTSFGTVTLNSTTGVWTWTKPVVLADSGTVVIHANLPGGTTVAASFYLIVTPRVAYLELSQPAGTPLTNGASTVNFGTVDAGATTARVFTVRNTGDGLLHIWRITTDGGFAFSGTPPSGLYPILVDEGETTTFTIQLSGDVDGAKTGTLRLETNDGTNPIFTATLSGTVQAPEIAVSDLAGAVEYADGQTEPLDFGHAVSAPVDRTLLVRNMGTLGLSLSSISLPAGFTLRSPALATGLAPGAAAILKLRYTPGTPGVHTGTMSLTNTDADEASFDLPLRVRVGTPCGDLSFVRRRLGKMAFLPEGPVGIAAADFDRDGNLDIVATGYGTNVLWLLRGDGAGGFLDTPRYMTVPDRPRTLAVGDFNGDGFPDVVIGHDRGTGPVSVLLNVRRVSVGLSSLPPFSHSADSPLALVGGSAFVAVGDCNGDGLPDVAAADWNANVISIARGNKGRFTVPVPAQLITTLAHPSGIVITDFNLDGKADIAVSNQIQDITAWPPTVNAGKVQSFQGNGGMSFTEMFGSPGSAGTWPFGIATADFDANEYPDLAVANYFSDFATIRMRSATDFSAGPTMSVPVSAVMDTWAIRSGDFNADGRPDLLTVNSNRSLPVEANTGLHLGNGDGSFSPGATLASNDAWLNDAIVADFNNDGVDDLAIADSNGVYIRLNGSCQPPDLRVYHNPTAPFVDGLSTFDLGAVDVGTVRLRQLTLSSVSLHDVKNLSFTVDGPDAADFVLSALPGPAEVIYGPDGSYPFHVSFAPSTTGIKHAVLHVFSNDPVKSPFDINLLGYSTLTYDSWAAVEGLTASDPSASPTGDGVSNLLRYALNISTLINSPAAIEPGNGTSGMPSVSMTGSTLRMEFVRRHGALLTYTPQRTAALGTWTAFTSTPTVTVIDSMWDRVVYEEPLTGPDTVRQFARLMVTLP